MRLNTMIRKSKKEKGFSLIELLVVVAIIGILAAVGVVAYTGYTAKAKINSVATQHASIAKYIAAEFQKCNLGESAIFVDQNCGSNMGTTSTLHTSAANVLHATFKNAYERSKSAFSDASGDAVTACTVDASGCHTITYTASTKTAVVTSSHVDPSDNSKQVKLTSSLIAD